jgi:MFS family permease
LELHADIASCKVNLEYGIISFLLTLTFSFPNRSGSVYALAETTFGAGYMMGPFVGALLYDHGGFLLPFLVSGSFTLITGKTYFC